MYVPPAHVIAVTEQPYFAAAAMRHIVTVQTGEHTRERLFFRTGTTSNEHPRHVCTSEDGPGHYFVSESMSTFEYERSRGIHDELPETTHDSFDDFLKAIGYDWRSNRYGTPPDAAIAA